MKTPTQAEKERAFLRSVQKVRIIVILAVFHSLNLLILSSSLFCILLKYAELTSPFCKFLTVIT